MEEKENFKGNKMVLTIIGLAVLVVATIGATFAYFSATSDTVNQKVTTGELKVDASSSISDNTNIKPTTWVDKATADSDTDIAKVKLTVDASGTTITTGKYDIDLTTTGIELKTQMDSAVEGNDKITLDGGKLTDVRWALYKDEEPIESQEVKAIAEGNFGVKNGEENGEPTYNDNATDGDFNNVVLNPEPIQISVEDNGISTQTDKYILYIWIENTEDTTDAEGNVISGKQDKLQNMSINATLRVSAKQ